MSAGFQIGGTPHVVHDVLGQKALRLVGREPNLPDTTETGANKSVAKATEDALDTNKPSADKTTEEATEVNKPVDETTEETATTENGNVQRRLDIVFGNDGIAEISRRRQNAAAQLDRFKRPLREDYFGARSSDVRLAMHRIEDVRALALDARNSSVVRLMDRGEVGRCKKRQSRRCQTSSSTT